MINPNEVKPGDTVWCIERDDNADPSDYCGYIFVAGNEECVIVASEPVGYEGTISQYLIEDTTECSGTEVYAFPLNDAYSTRDECAANCDK